MLEQLEQFIGEVLTDEVRAKVEYIWEGYLRVDAPDGQDEDHDETRLNIYVDKDHRITSFRKG